MPQVMSMLVPIFDALAHLSGAGGGLRGVLKLAELGQEAFEAASQHLLAERRIRACPRKVGIGDRLKVPHRKDCREPRLSGG